MGSTARVLTYGNRRPKQMPVAIEHSLCSTKKKYPSPSGWLGWIHRAGLRWAGEEDGRVPSRPGPPAVLSGLTGMASQAACLIRLAL